jgi:hypothetical protein
MRMDSFYCRICWNSRGWVFPSGDAATVETDSFVTEHGYGHEEWLFNFSWLIDDKHYAFLQPVARSRDRFEGQEIHLYLYTIDPNKQRLYVAEISSCEVLTLEQASDTLRHYKNLGWFKSMRKQIGALGIDPDDLDTSPLSCFNVRFGPEDVHFYDPLRVAGPDDFVVNLNRYTLTPAQEKVTDGQWRRPNGTAIPPTISLITRSGQAGTTIDPVELAMEAELLLKLQAEFGKDNVCRQMHHVDLTLRTPRGSLLIELKSDPDARQAIRKALGQVMEYAYFNPSLGKLEHRLMIISPGIETNAVKQYLALLNDRFNIPVSYCKFALGEPLPSPLRKEAWHYTATGSTAP